ncbi:MAG: hypothetical protein ACPG1A_08555 [Halioglobus sp.]
MTYSIQKLFVTLCLQVTVTSVSIASTNPPLLPDWLALEFEERAFWATAKSRLEVGKLSEDSCLWELRVDSSVVGNSEQISLDFDPSDGSVAKRVRLSTGKRGKEQRLKAFEYGPDEIIRERRTPGENPQQAPRDWPLASRINIDYPITADQFVVTSPHLLIVLAQQLQRLGTGASRELLVHTDWNFYRVRMTVGNGIPIEANYTISENSSFTGKRETVAVVIQADPEGELTEKPDFRVLGLSGYIIVFFDKVTGLPLQVRGTAPRIGDTDINLRAVTMRSPSR